MFRRYGAVLRVPAFRKAELISLLARLPQYGFGVTLTLHVVSTLGMSYAAAGVVAAGYTVAAAIAAPWRGRLLDRHGLRRTVAPSLVIVPLVWGVAPFLPYWMLIIACAVGGLFSLPLFSLIRQIVVAAAPEGVRRTALSLDSVIVELNFMIGPLLAIAAATTFGTRPTLIALTVLTSVGGAFLAIVNPPLVSGAEEAEPTGSTGRRWVSAPVVGVYGAVLAAGIVLGGTEVSLVATLRTFGQTELLGLAITVWSAGSAIGGLVYGAWHRSIPSAVLLTGLAALTLPVAAAPTVTAVLAIVLASGFFCAPLISATVDELNGRVPESVRGEAMGWHGSALTAGSSLGPPVVGMMLDAFGWRAGFLTAGGVGLAVAAVVVLMTSRRVRTALPDA
ncbi:MAG TPA: MFS transporter [Propionibacteriaceae bacterium]|nr:MFS transporter [Propionibacteriaceae bacterium]